MAMNETYFELDDPRLPQDVLTLNEAIDTIDNSILTETMQLAMQNGYFLYDVSADGYTLQKTEVEQ